MSKKALKIKVSDNTESDKRLIVTNNESQRKLLKKFLSPANSNARFTLKRDKTNKSLSHNTSSLSIRKNKLIRQSITLSKFKRIGKFNPTPIKPLTKKSPPAKLKGFAKKLGVETLQNSSSNVENSPLDTSTHSSTSNSGSASSNSRRSS